MKENTNRSIVYNSLIMMARLVVTTVCGLLTTRFALQALGVTDFGLFALIGSIISFMSVLNTVMVPTSNRFISVALGKGDEEGVNEQFNINLSIHIAIAVLTLVVGLPVGHWYIHDFVNFDGDIAKAVMVYDFSIVGAAIAFVGVPFNGLLMAKERFFVFSSADVGVHVVKAAIAYSLLYHFADKLFVYAASQSILSALPTIIYYLYCRKHFKRFITFRLVRNRRKYRNVFAFSSWIAFGAFATIGQAQGAAMIINAMFNTAMNAALGIANTVNMLITLVANNIWQPMAPQITKSYAAGNRQRSDELLIMSTKFTFLGTLFISAPFLIDGHWIFSLWLGEVPPYVELFANLLIINSLVTALNSGISSIIFADGRIKLYQIIINTLRLTAILVAYFALRSGLPAYYLFYVYILFSVLTFIASQWALHKTLNYDNSILIKHSYLPSFVVVACFVPVCLIAMNIPSLLHICLKMIYLAVVVLLFGFSRNERQMLYRLISSRICRK